MREAMSAMTTRGRAFLAAGITAAVCAIVLGQQDLLPKALRGSPILFVLAFAPFGVMLFWLVRLRFARAIARSKRSGLLFIGREPRTNG